MEKGKTMLEKLFNPVSVAVVGASQTVGKVGYEIVANLKAGGFSGTIIPVNPAGGRLLGLTVHTSLSEYREPVDLVIIALPAELVRTAAKEAVRKKAGAVMVVSTGFSETGDEGRRAEEELARIIGHGNAVLLGPNSLGLMNTNNNLNASFAGDLPRPGSIAVFSQSATLCTAMLDMAAEHQLGFSKMISIGNKAGLSEVELLKALAEDEDTSVIIGYLEDISSGDQFIKAAEEASNAKPVILLKAGTTPAGRRAAATHTGVLAGTETAYGAAFKRSGVCRADTFNGLFDYAFAFAMQPIIRGKRILIITNAGGPGIMAADAVEDAGLEIAVLDLNNVNKLRSQLPIASLDNPIDLLGNADPREYAAALEIGQQDYGVDGILILLTPQPMTKPVETAHAVAKVIDGSKPVLASFMGGKDVLPGRQTLAAAGVPDYDSPERAVAAFRVMYEYGVWKNRPKRLVTRFAVNRRRVERIINRRRRINRLQLGEIKSKDILRAYGFHTMEGRLATTMEEAEAVARFLGFPVAMKVVSPDIIHKSDLGGVKLNLSSSREVEDAYELMMLRIRRNVPKAVIEGIYVEKMADHGLEVIIGMTRDPQFGPMLMFGLGGIFVEVMKDVAFHLAPITEDEAMQMLRSTRSCEMLMGKRGRKKVDMQALAVALQRISQLTTDFPQIVELDINPLIVGAVGTDPVVADARMSFAPDTGD
jgi:acetyltransferase